MTNTADQRNANNVKKLIDFVKDNLFDKELDDDDPFFFGINQLEGEIEVGDGSTHDHFNLMISSKYLLSFLGKYLKV